MAADALSWLPTNQADESNFDNDLPVYAVVNYHVKPDERVEKEQNSLTIQEFVVAQRGDGHC